MFQLHDKTRRRVCLAAFLLLCVLPTTAVLGWCVYRHRPGYVDAEALRLSRELGLEVSIEKFERLSPGQVRYEGVELTDPESGRCVLRCRVVRAAWTDTVDAKGESRPTLELTAVGPVVEAESFDALGRRIAERLHRRAGRSATDVRLNASELILHAQSYSDTLTEFHGRIEARRGTAQAWAQFRPTGSMTAQPVALRLVRIQQTGPSTAAFELDTNGNELPCRILAMGLKQLEPLGTGSRFRGYFGAKETSTADATAPLWDAGPQWDVDVIGALLDVDLDGLISKNFPHTLSGTATVEIRQARFEQGRLTSASGTLLGGPGLDPAGTGASPMISRSLIDAAVEQLGLVRGGEPKTHGDPVPYEHLALGFVVDADGLRLQGRGAGTVLMDRHSRLLSTADNHPRPVVGLLRALAPRGAAQVPATRQTDWLMQYLPIPDTTASRNPAPAFPWTQGTSTVRPGAADRRW